MTGAVPLGTSRCRVRLAEMEPPLPTLITSCDLGSGCYQSLKAPWNCSWRGLETRKRCLCKSSWLWLWVKHLKWPWRLQFRRWRRSWDAQQENMKRWHRRTSLSGKDWCELKRWRWEEEMALFIRFTTTTQSSLAPNPFPKRETQTVDRTCSANADATTAHRPTVGQPKFCKGTTNASAGMLWMLVRTALFKRGQDIRYVVWHAMTLNSFVIYNLFLHFSL